MGCRCVVTLKEAKNYLRVDYNEDNALLRELLKASRKLCMDILRTDDPADLEKAENGKAAVLYTVAYLYEHREEADHHAMALTLRSLLSGSRKEGF